MFSPSPLPRSLEASFRDVASDRAATRQSAIRDLAQHAMRSGTTRSRTIPLLERALQDDGAASVRAEAAMALADLRAEEALSTLLVAIEDADPHVRQMALSAIGEIGDRRAVPRLERALRDDRPEVRYQGVIAFARVAKDDAAAVASAVAHALDDRDEAIRYIAMRVAEEYGLDGEPLRDERVAERAEQLVGTPDAAVAVVAALYLTRLGRSCGRALVLDVVAERRTTPELEDEQACVELVGELELREAIPHLERRVWGRRRVLRTVLSWGAGDRASCAWHARTALARMGHAKARSDIVADLGSWRRETREAAVVATGRARIGEARALLQGLEGSVDADLVREALVRLALD
ncbi:MAG: HEAT repeat domain-containing protein [Polyangiaceae bacterium]|jgi:HEAT repeat protein